MERKRRIPIGQNGAPVEPGQEEAAAMAPQSPPAPDGPDTHAAPQAPSAAEAAPALSAEERLAAATAERDEYLDGLLRLKAEFENFRKRSQRERDEAESRGRGRVLLEFLPILDNLGRALDAAEHHEEGKVLEGVRLTHSQFQSLLEKEGVSEVCPLGEPFDPEFHDAMLTQPSDQPEGIVTVVLERGYRMGDRVLRPARVGVSAGQGTGSDPRAQGAPRG